MNDNNLVHCIVYDDEMYHLALFVTYCMSRLGFERSVNCYENGLQLNSKMIA